MIEADGPKAGRRATAEAVVQAADLGRAEDAL
jgi:hypothetical protein